MKWLGWASVLALGLSVVINLDHLAEDVTADQESPIVRPQLSPQALKRRTPAAQADPAEEMVRAKILAVQQAIKNNPPHGRSWEYLPQDDFAVEVEKWVDEILETAGLDISDRDVMMVGQHYYKYNDPYLRYLGLTLMYRSGPEKDWQIGLLWQLIEHPHFGDYHIEDEGSASHERLVRQKLIVELTDRYGYKIVSDLKRNSTEEEHVEIKSRFENANRTSLGLLKIEALWESID